jgi:hypothetical protein
MEPSRLGAVVLGSWLLKLVVLVVVLALLDRSDAWSRPAFFATFVLGVVGWLLVEGLLVVRTRVPYVEATPPPDAAAAPAAAGAADGTDMGPRAS